MKNDDIKVINTLLKNCDVDTIHAIRLAIQNLTERSCYAGKEKGDNLLHRVMQRFKSNRKALYSNKTYKK